MTPEQMQMARHALGLPNKWKRSYRNHYSATLVSSREAAWDELVRQGMAERGKDGAAIVGFCLTLKGATAALHPGETLDPEDFPEAVLPYDGR